MLLLSTTCAYVYIYILMVTFGPAETLLNVHSFAVIFNDNKMYIDSLLSILISI
jgi:hypothetical protein